MLTFRDAGEKLELEGNLLKRITNKNYNVDLANLSIKKVLYKFAMDMFLTTKL